jgi:hypothetical protein
LNRRRTPKVEVGKSQTAQLYRNCAPVGDEIKTKKVAQFGLENERSPDFSSGKIHTVFTLG